MTAATLLSRRGWSVELFEKDAHPRFHIGESLPPMNVPILEELGVLDEARRISVLKPGADFTSENGARGYQTFQGCIAIVFENRRFLKMLAIRKSQFAVRRVEKAMDGFFNKLPGASVRS